MEPRDLRENKVQWVQLEMMENKVQQGPRVQEEEPVPWVCPDQRDPLGTQARLERLEALDPRGRGV